MPKAAHTNVELYLTHKEWLDWSRAAQKAQSDLPAWIRTVVNAARAAPVPSRKASPRARREALHWEDEAGYAAVLRLLRLPGRVHRDEAQAVLLRPLPRSGVESAEAPGGRITGSALSIWRRNA
jgi:hypothetical protein